MTRSNLYMDITIHTLLDGTVLYYTEGPRADKEWRLRMLSRLLLYEVVYLDSIAACKPSEGEDHAGNGRCGSEMR